MNNKDTIIQELTWDIMIFIIIVGIIMIALGFFFFFTSVGAIDTLQRWVILLSFNLAAIINTRMIIRTYRGK